MESIVEELGIPQKYLKNTSSNDRYIAFVHRQWLKSLVMHFKLIEFSDKSDKFDSWMTRNQSRLYWERITISVIRKWNVKVLPLPKMRKLNESEVPLFHVQLLQYISHVNYRNLNRNAKKRFLHNDSMNKKKQINLVDYNDALREIIRRIYGCPMVNVCDENSNINVSEELHSHPNVLPSVCCVETLNFLFLLHIPFVEYSVRDAINFSPAILEKCFTKPLFIIYQLIQTLRCFHDRSLTLGNISLDDIYLTENLWIYILPDIISNLHVKSCRPACTKEELIHDCSENGHSFNYHVMKCEYCGIRTYDKIQTNEENLELLFKLWSNGNISNFTYISALNNLSGRIYGDPNCHHVFPWVTDFASRCGKNWRDLKKSKYRLNKGDRQLDMTYEGSQSQISHHVSDVLSAITYYVYMARKTPKSILCKNVRSMWVPAEYPSSIQRMQEWTPDECIPEFFTDPSIFRSIHDDLDDLEVPGWCSGPEDFIEKHRAALESQHVSERIHHWIDLTFGYKLSGIAAVKAKNVCLHLADDHTNLTKSGIVQLFTQPHPSKYSVTQLFAFIPNKAPTEKLSRQRARDRSQSSLLEHNRTDVEEGIDDSGSVGERSFGFTRFLSESRTSLNEESDHRTARSMSVGPKSSTSTSHVTLKSRNQTLSKPDVILLPRDYRPELALDQLEKRHSFLSKALNSECDNIPCQKSEELPSTEMPIGYSNVENSFPEENFQASNSMKLFRNSSRTDQNVVHISGTKQKLKMGKKYDSVNCDYSELISKCKVKELKMLGCIIVELFQSRKLQSLTINRKKLTFDERFTACSKILKSYASDFPPCARYIAELLLQPTDMCLKNIQYSVISEFGLPTPTSHLLLEPLIHYNIPFPKQFTSIYRLLSILRDLVNVSDELNILYYFDCDGSRCFEYENLEKRRMLLVQNIAECKVKTFVRITENVFTEFNTTTEIEMINIMLPHIIELIEDPPTSVLAAWYLFDSFSKLLGPQKTSITFLSSILKLYENEPTESTLPFYGRIAKLYHHSFLLRLMVRLGLKCFLNNFIVPIVEAVGGYRDFEKVEFFLHSHQEKILKRTSHLRTMDMDQIESIRREDTSYSIEKAKAETFSQKIISSREPEIFNFDEENQTHSKNFFENLEVSATPELVFNHSIAEEALDAALSENIDHLRNLEELKINIIEDSYEQQLMSPTLPIPRQKAELSNIECYVGSKKSENEDVIDTPNVRNLYSLDDKEMLSGDSERKTNGETKISDMSVDSLIWLSHRLGPVLTARYLSRNLLKMLTLCYVGKENLTPVSNNTSCDDFSITSSHVVGDRNAAKVLQCLGSIAGLYGEQFILFQFIPHMSELIALCKRKITFSLEGGLISSLALLKHVIPYLSDSTLMDQLQDSILKNVIHPVVRLLGSTKYCFPSECIARNALAKKYIDTLYFISVRIGTDMTRTHLSVPALQRFFLIFDKVHTNENYNYSEEWRDNIPAEQEESSIVEVNRDGSTKEWSITSRKPMRITNLIDSESTRSLSPPDKLSETLKAEITAFEELQTVFNPQLAHTCYIPFLRLLGANSLEISLKNNDTIRDLCKEFTSDTKNVGKNISIMPPEETPMIHSSSIGSNVAVIGNRIDVQKETDNASIPDLLSLVSNRIENNKRHLRGNWLAYWGHEIGRSDKDIMFNFKQIKLQNFNGHTNSVKCLHVLDNENSFISGSRDKTVKLWSLRSEGDGTSVSNCQWTYTGHRKSVLSLSFVESVRLVASCDSVIHIWDPYMGVNIGSLESPKHAPVNVLKSMPAPSCLVYAATTDGTLKLIDTRLCTYIYELKVSVNPPGLIRCLAIAPSGLWVAAGQSSGNISILDTRTGLIISSWRAHEAEVLQLVAIDDYTLISSSLDQTTSVWNVSDGKFKFHMRGSTEPIHCLNVYNNKELISGSTANRIGVHTSIGRDSSFSSTKLRPDVFKGLLTSMALLPLNRLLLLAADTGNISLLC